MRLEYRSNNAYDTIILVDPSTGLAVSRWDATPETVENFLDTPQDANLWDDHHNQDKAQDFGDLLGWRDGDGPVIMSTEMSRSAEEILARIQANLN